jgi:hypothetical protein
MGSFTMGVSQQRKSFGFKKQTAADNDLLCEEQSIIYQVKE